jgi:hypothetical protein
MDYLRPFPAGSCGVHAAGRRVAGMADLFATIGMLVFALAMIGLIKGLEHV